MSVDDLLGGPVARCNLCGRVSYAPDAIATEDRMTQPDGRPCGGVFEEVNNGD